jgi:hypothetical protein
MKIRNALKNIAIFAATTWAGSTFAHEGHAMTGAHWHATDVWGFVAMACVLGIAIWLSRGDK